MCFQLANFDFIDHIFFVCLMFSFSLFFFFFFFFNNHKQAKQTNKQTKNFSSQRVGRECLSFYTLELACPVNTVIVLCTW